MSSCVTAGAGAITWLVWVVVVVFMVVSCDVVLTRRDLVFRRGWFDVGGPGGHFSLEGDSALETLSSQLAAMLVRKAGGDWRGQRLTAAGFPNNSKYRETTLQAYSAFWHGVADPLREPQESAYLRGTNQR